MNLPQNLAAAEQSAAPVKLTAREKEILVIKGNGFSSREVADQLFVSKRTVDFHLANVYEKLNVTNLTAALLQAQKRGIVSVFDGRVKQLN